MRFLWAFGWSLDGDDGGSSFTYEVIVVDDGSTDGTAQEVERWVTQLGTDAVRLLTLKENQGKGAAVGKVHRRCIGVHISIHMYVRML